MWQWLVAELQHAKTDSCPASSCFGVARGRWLGSSTEVPHRSWKQLNVPPACAGQLGGWINDYNTTRAPLRESILFPMCVHLPAACAYCKLSCFVTFIQWLIAESAVQLCGTFIIPFHSAVFHSAPPSFLLEFLFISSHFTRVSAQGDLALFVYNMPHFFIFPHL